MSLTMNIPILFRSNAQDMQTIIRSNTWYGIPAVIAVKTGILHMAGFGRLLLRQGVRDRTSVQLNISHEFGHLQTLPLVLVYAGTLMWYSIIREAAGFLVYSIPVISILAFWEMLAEGYAIVVDESSYAEAYREVEWWPRIIFWVLTMGITTAGWFVLP